MSNVLVFIFYSILRSNVWHDGYINNTILYTGNVLRECISGSLITQKNVNVLGDGHIN